MNTWNRRSAIIRATIAGINGFVLNMDKKVDKGMHVKECGNLKRSFVGPHRAETNLHGGWSRIAPCCKRRAWDRLWPVIKEDEVYKKIVEEDAA